MISVRMAIMGWCSLESSMRLHCQFSTPVARTDLEDYIRHLEISAWLGRSQRTRPIENPEPFKLYIVGSPLPADDHEMLLTLVYAQVERRWNRTPPFDIVPPNPKRKHGGKKYQARCLELLQWLHAEGDITSLEVPSGS
jgi:hypothetical protein